MGIVDALRKLHSSGRSGFEGLIVELLGELTGQRFRLAPSGSQMGRDLSVAEATGNVTAVECKRYKATTSLDERELSGELLQAAVSIPDLDIWVLVASRPVDDRLFNLLRQSAEHVKIKFVCIAHEDQSPSTLQVLCAQAADTTLAKLLPVLSHHELQSVREELARIAGLPDYDSRRISLRNEFIDPLVGYSAWSTAQNQWFQHQSSTEQASKAAFGQPLNVDGTNPKLIKRLALWQRVDQWLADWPVERNVLVVLGEEGDGKSWGVASWLNHRLKRDDDSPPTLFVSSLRAAADSGHDLLQTIVADQLRSDNAKLRPRLERWLRADHTSPAAVLVLDGINERRSPSWWRELISDFAGNDSLRSVAVVVTCRTRYWKRELQSPLELYQVKEYVLPSYDDAELEQALDRHGLRTRDIEAEILPLIRKPRYFDLAMHFRGKMMASGDITPARLVYEDWRDRWQRKTGTPVNDEEFFGLLRDLAEEHLAGTTMWRSSQIQRVVGIYSEKDVLLEELRSGGILEEKQGRYAVNSKRLECGLGLLLVDRLTDAHSQESAADLHEVAAQWLEPMLGIDIKSGICEMAALHAMCMGGIDQEVVITLLALWLTSQNPGEAIESTFSAYMPISPIGYTSLAEIVWASDHDSRWAQDLLMHTFRRWYSQAESVTSALHVAFDRWLGFVHIHGFPITRDQNDESVDKVRNAVVARIGHDLHPGSVEFAGMSLTAIDDDGLLRLGRVALAVISHFPRAPFVSSIAVGCVAEAIVDYPDKYDLFRWIFVTSTEALWDEVHAEVQKLLATDSIVTRQAAYRLLSYEGSNSAYQLQKQLPSGLFPKHALVAEYEQDPCHSLMTWTKDDCERCIQRDDLKIHVIATRLQTFSLDPSLSYPADMSDRLSPLAQQFDPRKLWTTMVTGSEDNNYNLYEPALCAVAAHRLTDVIRQVVSSISGRDGIPLRQASIVLREHSLLFGEKEFTAIQEKWRELLDRGDLSDESTMVAEMFLFEMVLQGIGSATQICYLLERPPDATNLVRYENYFRPVENWTQIEELLSQKLDEPTLVRLFWFLARSAEDMPREMLKNLVAPLLASDSSTMRAAVLRVVFEADADSVGQCVANSWSWSPENHEAENHWGSLTLCRYGSAIELTALYTRIDPVYLGYALACRGNQHTDMREFSRILQANWLVQCGTELADVEDVISLPDFWRVSNDHPPRVTDKYYLDTSVPGSSRTKIRFVNTNLTWGGGFSPDDEDLPGLFSGREEKVNAESARRVIEVISEQRDSDNHWFGRYFPSESLDVVMREHPEFLDLWIGALFTDGDINSRLLYRTQPFYETLCSVLLRHTPETGVVLYEILESFGRASGTLVDRRTGFTALDRALFGAPRTKSTIGVWQRKIGQCKTDRDLLNIVTLLQLGGNVPWLEAYVDHEVSTPSPLEWSRAVTILGFVDGRSSLQRLQDMSVSAPHTWRVKLIECSVKRWEINSWAKDWYQRMYSATDSTNAWAALRLVLHCVDTRFWAWRDAADAEASVHPHSDHRRNFVQNHLESISNRVNRNAAKLEDYLFGQKVINREVWPWM